MAAYAHGEPPPWRTVSRCSSRAGAPAHRDHGALVVVAMRRGRSVHCAEPSPGRTAGEIACRSGPLNHPAPRDSVPSPANREKSLVPWMPGGVPELMRRAPVTTVDCRACRKIHCGRAALSSPAPCDSSRPASPATRTTSLTQMLRTARGASVGCVDMSRTVAPGTDSRQPCGQLPPPAAVIACHGPPPVCNLRRRQGSWAPPHANGMVTIRCRTLVPPGGLASHGGCNRYHARTITSRLTVPGIR